MLDIHQLAQQCDKVKWQGKDSFKACCPSHDDRNPSMTVTEAPDGTILVHCFSGCEQMAVLEALGMLERNPLPNPRPKPRPKPMPSKPPATYSYAVEVWRESNDDDPPPSYEPDPEGYRVDTHPYAAKKLITHAFGARRGTASGRLIGKSADCVIVPNRDWEGQLVGVECINEDGLKQTFGSKGLLVLGYPEGAPLIHVCEGWATAWALSKLFQDQFACVVAFGKSKLETLSDAARVSYRGIVVVHHDDKENRDVWDRWESGHGQQYAENIMRRINGR